MEIKIKYLADGIDEIKRIKVGDWIDLRSAETVTMFPGDLRYIRLGVAIQLPEGYEAIVAPRSSTAKNYGILMANSIGVIDETYCGDNDEWMFPALAFRNTTVFKNERICQFRIIRHQPSIFLSIVKMLGNHDRGGLGSTGKS